jgi:hypothetical protein
MNERITQLAVEAGFFPVELTQVGPSVEKFAQLIVEECVMMADAFELDVNRSGQRFVYRMKEHFGIEE